MAGRGTGKNISMRGGGGFVFVGEGFVLVGVFYWILRQREGSDVASERLHLHLVLKKGCMVRRSFAAGSRCDRHLPAAAFLSWRFFLLYVPSSPEVT